MPSIMLIHFLNCIAYCIAYCIVYRTVYCIAYCIGLSIGVSFVRPCVFRPCAFRPWPHQIAPAGHHLLKGSTLGFREYARSERPYVE